MFRTLSILTVLSILALANCDEETYPDKYDHINAEEILNNDKLRNQYYQCFMDTGPCVTADAQFFKGFLPEVIVTQCRKCTKRQKESFETIVTWYTEKYPEEWDALVDKLVMDAHKLGIKPN